MSELAKQIKLNDDVYSELTAIGHKNETYNDIVRRLLDFYRRGQRKEK